MSITTTTQLKEFMGLVDVPTGGAESLESAEVLTAAYLGTSTLAQVTQAELITPVRTKYRIETVLAPITSLTSVTYGDPAVTVDDTSVPNRSPWLVEATGGFTSGTIYTVNYTSGWTSGTLPEEVKRGILAIAESLLDGGGRGVAAESIGDYSRTTVPSESSTTIPPIARELLLPWRRPQL